MPTADPQGDGPTVQVRPGDPTDLPAVAEVHLAARAAAVPDMPPGIHPDDEVRAWVRGWDLDEQDLWVAETGGRLVGYARAHATWLDDLYVAPETQGRGVGSLLLEVVQAHRPAGFGLWVFCSNLPARAFYRRHGLTEAESTDGADNEEKAPDLRMVWAGADRT